MPMDVENEWFNILLAQFWQHYRPAPPRPAPPHPAPPRPAPARSNPHPSGVRRPARGAQGGGRDGRSGQGCGRRTMFVRSSSTTSMASASRFPRRRAPRAPRAPRSHTRRSSRSCQGCGDVAGGRAAHGADDRWPRTQNLPRHQHLPRGPAPPRALPRAPLHAPARSAPRRGGLVATGGAGRASEAGPSAGGGQAAEDWIYDLSLLAEWASDAVRIEVAYTVSNMSS